MRNDLFYNINYYVRVAFFFRENLSKIARE